jgi:hypothetical protein
MWLRNVSWKRAPDCGLADGNGRYQFARSAVHYPAFPPFSWTVEDMILPFFVPFGWVALLAGPVLTVLLLTGIKVRFAATLGLALMTATREGLAKAGFLAAGFGILAALPLKSQPGFSTPFLGGSPSSAAWLLSTAVIGLALSRFYPTVTGRAHRSQRPHRPHPTGV